MKNADIYGLRSDVYARTLWPADHFSVDRFGTPIEPRSLESYQFMTAGMDWKILIWDIRGKGGRQVVESGEFQRRKSGGSEVQRMKRWNQKLTVHVATSKA